MSATERGPQRQPDTRDPDEEQNGKREDQPARSGPRQLAEWVTLGVSALVILGLVGYLLYQAIGHDTRFLPVQVRARMEQVRRAGDRFVLPVEVANTGPRTLRELGIELTYRPPAEEKEERDLQIDYLGERSRQTVYFYFDRLPQEGEVEVRPVHYRLE